MHQSSLYHLSCSQKQLYLGQYQKLLLQKHQQTGFSLSSTGDQILMLVELRLYFGSDHLEWEITTFALAKTTCIWTTN